MYHRPIIHYIKYMDQITDELLQKTIGEMSGMEFIQLFKVANDVKADDSQENGRTNMCMASPE